MRSFQNLLVLQNLYRLKAVGYEYIDPIVINHKNDGDLPNDMAEIGDLIKKCHLCDLSKSRTQSLEGFGNTTADVMIVDAFVSTAEDESGNYFSGRSGQSLQKMIENVLHLNIKDIFFTHAVKCKPLGTQTPSNSEIQSCKPYLFKQIELIQPRIIIALGEQVYQMLSDDTTPFEQVRGQGIAFGNALIVPIYHPAFLLRNPSLKPITLHDLRTIKALI
ncbi:MAG: uracil-DNA glycosylase [Campylobacterota bacterium]|nr:uracil-DNA glycosylase [Campylobacterota bacterium]